MKKILKTIKCQKEEQNFSLFCQVMAYFCFQDQKVA